MYTVLRGVPSEQLLSGSQKMPYVTLYVFMFFLWVFMLAAAQIAHLGQIITPLDY